MPNLEAPKRFTLDKTAPDVVSAMLSPQDQGLIEEVREYTELAFGAEGNIPAVEYWERVGRQLNLPDDRNIKLYGAYIYLALQPSGADRSKGDATREVRIDPAATSFAQGFGVTAAREQFIERKTEEALVGWFSDNYGGAPQQVVKRIGDELPNFDPESFYAGYTLREGFNHFTGRRKAPAYPTAIQFDHEQVDIFAAAGISKERSKDIMSAVVYAMHPDTMVREGDKRSAWIERVLNLLAVNDTPDVREAAVGILLAALFVSPTSDGEPQREADEDPDRRFDDYDPDCPWWPSAV